MKLFLRSILFFAVASFAPLAFGQYPSWTGAAGDNSFETPGNWSPSGVPTGNNVNIVPASGVTFTVNQGQNESLSLLTFGGGAEQNGNHNLTGTVKGGIINFTTANTLTIT